MENRDKKLREGEELLVCEYAFWIGRRNEADLCESLYETSEELGCFSF